MHVVGTAGHVDHGKSSLVLALTGVDPDRLAEEKRRGMTIELGFAEWTLRSGRRAGLVDVPGHQRLVRTMIAGAHGVDLILLVVAADEGVMPQTREHLAICELLGTRRAVVALSKCDLVDAETLALAAAEVSDAVAASALRGAPVVPCSSRTGEGLDAVDAAVDAALAALPVRADRGRPRLFVDRAFSLPGFGPIVTGTLEGGALHAGDDVVLGCGGARARVRGLQRHGGAVTEATPGGRTAVNLAGVELSALRRGMALARPQSLRCSRRLDVRLRCHVDAPAPLRHGGAVGFHLGTAEVGARLWLLDGDEVACGGERHAQVTLDEPLPAAVGDRFVLRRRSPAATLGGGTVLDVAPRRHRRRDADVAAALSARERADDAGLVALELAKHPLGIEAVALARLCGLGVPTAERLLRAGGDAVTLGRRWLAGSRWDHLAARSTEVLAAHAAADPLRAGMPREEWRVTLRLPPALAADAVHRLRTGGRLEERGPDLALPGAARSVGEEVQATLDRLGRMLDGAGLDPPGAAALREAGLTPGLLRLLLADGTAVRVGALVVAAGAAAEARERVARHLEAHGSATVAELRDAVGATRRLMVPLLEWLDATRVTVRDGDVRRLRDGAPAPAR